MTWEGDVIVAGAGPAGSACATLLARRGLRVLLVDGRTETRRWQPAEILSPSALRLLRQHSLFVPSPSAEIASCAGVEGLWNGSVDFFDYQLLACEPAVSLPRPTLDAGLLAGAVEAGAELWSRVKVEAATFDGGWTVQSGGLAAHAPLIVESAGRNGRGFGPGSRRIYHDRLVALACPVALRAQPTQSLVLEATPNGWWYASSDAAGGGAAVFMTDADLLDPSVRREDIFRQELEATRLLRRRLPTLPSPLRLHGIDARTSRRERFSGQASIAIGDAVYSVDPLSGAGIQRSIETAVHGALAAEAYLQRHDENELAGYATWAEGDFDEWLTRKADVYAEVDPSLPKGEFWRRRLLAMA